MENWLKVTDYHFDRPILVALISPHGSSGREFLDHHRHVVKDRSIAERRQLWETYLRIEQDYGATELAHCLAKRLSAESSKLGCRVIEFNYPRGLIDGGRTIDHCLRPALPETMFSQLKDSFLAIHRQSLAKTQKFYHELQGREHLLIDVHTMASFCPHNTNGQAETIPVSWQQLDRYVDQFIQAGHMAKDARKIDIISATPCGTQIGDDRLRQHLIEAFHNAAYPFTENHPYQAAPEFLMYHHMSAARGIAIDVPKHVLAEIGRLEDFQLESFDISQTKLEQLADVITQALMGCFTAAGHHDIRLVQTKRK